MFPLSNLKNIRLYYIINAGLSFWLVEAVWYFYWSKLTSFSTIGTIFALLTFVWMILEIPSGAIADMFGRKKAMIVGTFSLALGSIVMVSAQNFWYLVFGGLFQNIGRAFISGSLEALVYDDLKSKNKEGFYDKVVTASTRNSFIVYAVATILGGFLYLVHFRLPHLLTAAVDVLIFVCSFYLIETRIGKPISINFRNYLLQNFEGFRQLFKKQLRPFIYLIIAVSTIFYLYDWGLSKPAMAVNFGYNSSGQGIIFSLMAGINVLVVGRMIYLRKKLGDFKGMIYLNLLLGLGFVLSIFPWGYVGVIILFLIESSGALAEPWISTIVNKYTNSQDRATTLSSLQFVSKLPFIFLVFISGFQVENQTVSQLHLLIGIVLIILSLSYLLFFHRSSTKVEII